MPLLSKSKLLDFGYLEFGGGVTFFFTIIIYTIHKLKKKSQIYKT